MRLPRSVGGGAPPDQAPPPRGRASPRCTPCAPAVGTVIGSPGRHGVRCPHGTPSPCAPLPAVPPLRALCYDGRPDAGGQPPWMPARGAPARARPPPSLASTMRSVRAGVGIVLHPLPPETCILGASLGRPGAGQAATTGAGLACFLLSCRTRGPGHGASAGATRRTSRSKVGAQQGTRQRHAETHGTSYPFSPIGVHMLRASLLHAGCVTTTCTPIFRPEYQML